jgi:hypothetical protein
MDSFIQALFGVILAVIASFLSWIAVRVVALGGKIVELENRVKNQEHRCDERLLWTREIDEKMNKVCEDTAYIRGKMEGKSK